MTTTSTTGEVFRSTAKTSHNLNSIPQLRKGLVTDVPGPKCNEGSGTLIPQEGLVTLLWAERRKMLWQLFLRRGGVLWICR
jgi:hypothetical protein